MFQGQENQPQNQNRHMRVLPRRPLAVLSNRNLVQPAQIAQIVRPSVQLPSVQSKMNETEWSTILTEIGNLLD